MKKILINLYLIILAFALVFLSCEKEIDENRFIEVTLNVSNITVTVDDLKSLNEDIFDGFPHVFQECSITLVNTKGDSFLLSCEDPVNDDVRVRIPAGTWRLPQDTFIYPNSTIYGNVFYSKITKYVFFRSAAQTLLKDGDVFNLYVMPQQDCIAVLDESNLLESFTGYYGGGILEENMMHHTNGIKVCYTHAGVMHPILMKLNDGREEYLNFSISTRVIKLIEDYPVPVFVKIELLPHIIPMYNVHQVEFLDTISYIFK